MYFLNNGDHSHCSSAPAAATVNRVLPVNIVLPHLVQRMMTLGRADDDSAWRRQGEPGGPGEFSAGPSNLAGSEFKGVLELLILFWELLTAHLVRCRQQYLAGLCCLCFWAESLRSTGKASNAKG